jgi:hypothetical protein
MFAVQTVGGGEGHEVVSEGGAEEITDGGDRGHHDSIQK